MESSGFSIGWRPILVVLLMFMFTVSSLQTVGGDGLKEVSSGTSRNPLPDRSPIVRAAGDLNRDGLDELIFSYPDNISNSGSLHIFYAKIGEFLEYSPSDEDITIIGDSGDELGSDFLLWDYNGDGWEDLVIGCPGYDSNGGSVLIFNAASLNFLMSIAPPEDRVLRPGDEDWALTYDGAQRFGSALGSGDFSGDGIDDLTVLCLSGGEGGNPLAVTYLGGSLPYNEYITTLPSQTVTEETVCTTLDIAGIGKDALVFSAPDKGSVRWMYYDFTQDQVQFPGSDEAGIVTFTGEIVESGNSFGWVGAEDGWDTADPHIYDDSTGYDSVRYNDNAINNVKGDRSVGRVNQLQIEMGGKPRTSYERNMSGAYGVSFHIDHEDLESAGNIRLEFDFIWEDWGFEEEERLWIKARLTNSTGDAHWLGEDWDTGRPSAPDASYEIWSMIGDENSQGQGRTLNGKGHYDSFRDNPQLFDLITGPGLFYLEMGGKISRWTANRECFMAGFDNISMYTIKLNTSFHSMTGPAGLGNHMASEDVDGDGHEDLIVSITGSGLVRVFLGNNTFWTSRAGFNHQDSNITITGTPGQGFGRSIMVMEPSPFFTHRSLVLSDPLAEKGKVYFFTMPMSEGDMDLTEANLTYNTTEEVARYGLLVFHLDDIDENGYGEMGVLALDNSDRLHTYYYEQAPSAPVLQIISPIGPASVSGIVDIVVEAHDIDGDATLENVEFHRSIDHTSWWPIEGDPHEIQGDQAVKKWNTTTLPNGQGQFIRVRLTDDFGLTAIQYTARLDILNPHPPQVYLSSPKDGVTISGVLDITATVIKPQGEKIVPPVRFHYSLDNSTWVHLADVNEPISGSTSAFVAKFNTLDFNDGPIWFLVNATAELGLEKEARNTDPVIIDNIYEPVGEILTPEPGSNVTGTVNVTLTATDLDDDILPAIPLELISDRMDEWEFLGNMTGPDANDTWYFLWNTTDWSNGPYRLRAVISDETNMKTVLVLSDPVRLYNPHTPVVSITDPEPGARILGLYRIKAAVEDVDGNVDVGGIEFQYRPRDSSDWTPIPGHDLKNKRAEVLWDTLSVPDGAYDLRITAIDTDNLTASAMVEGIVVSNPRAPVIFTLFPSVNEELSGVVKLRFIISDDKIIPLKNIEAEVLVYGSWEPLTGVVRETAGGEFVPWMNNTYYVDWNTAIKDTLTGLSEYPDGSNYKINIRVTDSDGLVTSEMTEYPYRVRNDVEGPEDDDPEADGISTLYIIIGAVALFILALIVFFVIFIRGGEKKAREEVAMPPPGALPKEKAEEIEGGEEKEALPEEPTTQLLPADEPGPYDLPGWGAAPSVEEAMPSLEDAELAMQAALTQETGKPKAVDRGDSGLIDDLFGMEAVDRVPPGARPEEDIPAWGEEEISTWGEEAVDIDLPEGVLPTQLKKKAPAGKKLKKRAPEPVKKRVKKVRKVPKKKAKRRHAQEEFAEVEEWTGDEDLEEFEEFDEF